MTDWYQLLQLAPSATNAEVRQAYHRARATAAATHNDPVDLARVYSDLDEAYAVLSDPGRRIAYDRQRGSTALGLSGSGPLVTSTPPSAAVTQTRACPHCGAPNPAQAEYCRQCRQPVGYACPHCGQWLAVDQVVCPRCQTYTPEYSSRQLGQRGLRSHEVKQARESRDTEVREQRARYSERAYADVVWWIVAVLAFLGICALSNVVFNFFS